MSTDSFDSPDGRTYSEPVSIAVPVFSGNDVREKCAAFRRGIVDLLCSEERGHDQPKDGEPGTWHRAVYVTRQEVAYPGARHLAEHSETVTWEPVDHAEESIRHMNAAVEAKRGGKQ